MHRDFSVRVPSDLRAGRESGATNVVARTDQPRRERDADVRTKMLYALAEWRGRREQAGQPKLVTAAIKTLRSVGRHERGVGGGGGGRGGRGGGAVKSRRPTRMT